MSKTMTQFNPGDEQIFSPNKHFSWNERGEELRPIGNGEDNLAVNIFGLVNVPGSDDDGCKDCAQIYPLFSMRPNRWQLQSALWVEMDGDSSYFPMTKSIGGLLLLPSCMSAINTKQTRLRCALIMRTNESFMCLHREAFPLLGLDPFHSYCTLLACIMFSL